MGLSDTVSAERTHICFFGMRNAGKSSLVNAFTGQNIALVSDVLGTTTDPVYKAMELLPLGPSMIVDTAGYDDTGELGKMRVEKTMRVLDKTDLAVIVIDALKGVQKSDEELLKLVKDRKIPYIIARNKADLLKTIPKAEKNEIYVSAKSNYAIAELKELAATMAKSTKSERKIVSDLVERGDAVILVVPIDKAAPKGRLILPQQQTIRDLLDCGAIAVVCRDSELLETLEKFSQKPRMVITDSQVFKKVAKIVPEDIQLTSFSVLFARYKGELWELAKGAETIERLQNGDKILISEGCTHHRQCGDIGTQKLPKMIEGYTKKNLEFHFTSGTEFPQNPKDYALIIHCGGCMLSETEMKSRMEYAKCAGVPMTNYGTAIAYVNGILERALTPLKKG
ncbi:MAG TPA: [FeFe] hydrogenase H-cluster maturation GTPase HydF [Clostridiales bacterium]|nr:[FeFe] hydrogenase H-cluster maturation GTPase HydF [Clostridiales bacterium]